MILLILNKSFEILLKLWSFLFLIKVDFFLPQTTQFVKSINLFCLVFLKLELTLEVFFTTNTISSHCFYIIYSTEISRIFISSLISLSSVKTLFTKINSSCITYESFTIYESIKDSEIRTLMVFDLSFPNNTIFSCFFFFFTIIDLYLLISTVISQFVIPTAELVIPAGTQTNEANVEIEMQPLELAIWN